MLEGILVSLGYSAPITRMVCLIYGRKGVKRLTDGLTQAFGRDLEIRGNI